MLLSITFSNSYELIANRGADSTAVFCFEEGTKSLDNGALEAAWITFNKGLESASENGQDSLKGKILLSMGELKDYLGEYDQARSLCDSAMEIGLASNDSSLIAHSLNALACSHLFEGNYEDSERYFSKALTIYRDIEDLSNVAYVMSNQASLNLRMDRPNDAIMPLEESLRISRSLSDSSLLTTCSINLGVAHLLLDNFDESQFRLNEGLNLSRKLGLNKYEVQSLLNLGDLHYNFELFQESADYYEEYHLLKDSLYSAETALKIEQIQAEFELAKEEAITARQALATKEKELKNTELQLTIFGIIGFVVLLAGITLAWYTRRKAVQQAQTQAILDTKEAENKRVTDLFWKEIGLSSKEKKLILQGRELPEHTIPGAIAAAKFLSNQRHNPFLQLGLVEAVDHLLQNLFLKSSCNYHFEYIPIKLEKDGRLFSYRVIEDVLTHVADSCKEGDVKVSIEEKGKDLICRVSANQLNPTEDLNLRSAEARLSLVKGKVKQKEKEGITEFKIEIPKVKVGLEEVKG